MVCNRLVDQGIRIIVTGLDMDYMGNPFGPMPALMAIAEDKLVVLGETDSYEPLCRNCYNKIMKKNNNNSKQ